MSPNHAQLSAEVAAADARAFEGGGRARQDRHLKLGRLLPRQRIEQLVDEGSFYELERHATARPGSAEHVMSVHRHPGDGVIAGLATIQGLPVAVYAHDPTVLRGALGTEGARKVCRLQDLALARKIPVIALVDSDGIRLEEGTDGIDGYGEVIARTMRLKGVAPQLTLVCGLAVGAAAYNAALTDCVVMIEGQSYMFITGPTVTRAVSGEDVTLDQLGGPALHAKKTGSCHAVVETEAAGLAFLKGLLRAVQPKVTGGDSVERLTPELETLIPTDERKPYRVVPVVEALFDKGSVLELSPSFAGNLSTCLARMDGRAVGVLASNPQVLAGCLDIDASRKGAAFVAWVNSLGLPIVTLVDVPGYLPGLRQEEGGIIPHGATLLAAFGQTRVPVVSLILRKSFGGANVLSFAAQTRLALPTARIGPMGADAAFDVLYGPAPTDSDGLAQRAEKKARWLKEQDSALAAARSGYVERVVMPEQARSELARAIVSFSA